MSHTPGPWRLGELPNQIVYAKIADLDSEHRIARAEEDWVGYEEARANACLIAAAPDLLAVAEMVVELDLQNYTVYMRSDLAAVAKAAREAIRKAKEE